ncbi:MAG: hypothetical protein ACRD2N_16810 [Vicinamibacterales bacterium]
MHRRQFLESSGQAGGALVFAAFRQSQSSWNGFIANHDQWLMRVESADDLTRVKGSGKVVLLGLQDSTHFRLMSTSFTASASACHN